MEFQENGLNAKHVDGKTIKKYVKKYLNGSKIQMMQYSATLESQQWVGFDEPSINTVIVNRSTTSLPLYGLQMTFGQGKPNNENKRMLKLIDPWGINAQNLGEGTWNADRDWDAVFHHPDKPKEDGNCAPVKDCPQCDILHARVMTCQFCGRAYIRKEKHRRRK